MKCGVCKINNAEPNSIVCSENCNKIRLKIIEMTFKYTPTNGCDNCHGDLHIGCTDKCNDEFKKAHEFNNDINLLLKLTGFKK